MCGAEFRCGFAVRRLTDNVVNFLLESIFVIVAVGGFHFFFQLADALFFFFSQDGVWHGKAVLFTVGHVVAQLAHAKL
ncbi:hypothetical protein D3C80_1488300 [compost metagenome]